MRSFNVEQLHLFRWFKRSIKIKFKQNSTLLGFHKIKSSILLILVKIIY